MTNANTELDNSISSSIKPYLKSNNQEDEIYIQAYSKLRGYDSSEVLQNKADKNENLPKDKLAEVNQSNKETNLIEDKDVSSEL